LIFVVLSVVKLIVLIMGPKRWCGPANPIKLVWNQAFVMVLSNDKEVEVIRRG